MFASFGDCTKTDRMDYVNHLIKNNKSKGKHLVMVQKRHYKPERILKNYV